MTGAGAQSAMERVIELHEGEEPSTCPWCGEFGIGFDESDPPSDYCGHDPALVRSRA